MLMYSTFPGRGTGLSDTDKCSHSKLYGSASALKAGDAGELPFISSDDEFSLPACGRILADPEVRDLLAVASLRKSRFGHRNRGNRIAVHSTELKIGEQGHSAELLGPMAEQTTVHLR